MKNRKSIIALLLVAIIGIVGLTVAYFSNSTNITNEFETAEYGTDVTETFTSPTGWQPGDETPKVLTVKNTGEVDEAVRIKVEEKWVNKNGEELPLIQDGNVAAQINYINNDDWTRVDVANEDYYYYYYNYKLAPDEETSELLDKVTFNPLINASTTCTDSIGTNGETIRSCKSNGSGYDGATYTLKFTIETVQYNKYADAWNTDVAIAEEKPHLGTLTLLEKTNPVSVTNYTDGNIHEMYTFEHEATAQTPALTDYRYIGDDPYNYVYFNCDSLDNQNSETCEVWRIIGVFDVEREVDDEENPGEMKTITETRIKLVRGSDFLDKMSWDSNQTNDWTNASLETYLNETYYNSLTSSAQSQIENAKHYLGGKGYNSTTHFGSTKDVYAWERGSEVFSYETYCLYYSSNSKCTTANYCSNNPNEAICNATRSISWLGTIALMYPSDMYMTYANGVDDLCYNDPLYASCRPTTAINSWVYNTNRLEGGPYVSTWFLSPYSNTKIYVLLANQIGVYDVDGTKSSYGVRPTLYLSADVQIFDGDGSSGNPYKLK